MKSPHPLPRTTTTVKGPDRPEGCDCPFPGEDGYVKKNCPVHDPTGTYHDDFEDEPMADEYGNHYATIRLLLEDVTEDTALKFFGRLDGHEIDLRLDDGLLYTASVETVAADV